MDIRILGPIRLHGRIWRATHLKPRSLIALLLVHANKPVSRDRMIEYLWDDDCPPDARQTLSTYVARAKRALERAVAGARITRISGGYSLLLDADRVDFHRFRSLVAESEAVDDPVRAAQLLELAVDLWRDGYPLGESDTSSARRMRDDLVRGELIPAYRALFDAKLAVGDHGYVLDELPAVLDQRPYDEHLAAQHMRAMDAAGRARDIPDFHRAFVERYTAEYGSPPDLRVRKPQDSAVPETPRPALADLPRDNPYFIGRDDVLHRLDEATTRRDALVAIDGPPGIGKSALIVHWVRARMDHFPDGVLYKNMQGFSASAPLDPADVMADFLLSLGTPSTEVPPKQNRAALLRRSVSGKRLIVVLDNVSDADHARPLLAATNLCPVIISSRRSLTSLALSDNAYLINLQPLADRLRVELLRGRLGPRIAADPTAANAIAALTDGFPLALLIAGEHIATRPSVSLRDLAAQLRDRILDAGGAEDNTLRTVFSWSVNHLGAAERRLFDLLGVHPLPMFSGSVATAISGASRASTEQAVDRLLSARLLEQEGADHYRMHDLLHVLAAERSTEHADHGQARQRMVDWYVLSANAARHHATPDSNEVPELAATSEVEPMHFTDAESALTWFGVERPNLMEVIRLASRAGMGAQLWRLSAAVYEPIRRLGYLHEAMEASRLGISGAEADGDVIGQAGSVNNLGRIFELLHEDTEATRQYERALDLFLSIGHTYGQAVCLHNLATVAMRGNNFSDAVEHYRRSLTLLEQTDGSTWAIAKVHSRLGDLSARLDDVDEARVQYHLSLGLAKQIGDTAGAATTVTALARLHLGVEQFTTAVDYATAALPMHQQVMNRAGTATTLLVLAEAYLELNGGGTVEAEAAAGIYQELQDQHGRADALEVLGRCHSSAGAHLRAAATWQECAKLLAPLDKVRAQRVSGWVHEAQARVAGSVPDPRLPTPLDDSAEPTRPMPR
ncbi:AfsR/SARP family transcriptional regulator [Actinokineospora terrae]|uniref:DNA-binding transcriptional activator of the SARP family n=1 Tax=Actinokineospora terrae TaxID=155974 RepID=A0A1H9VW90_9PSEU|nr:BTAD domain-containing putative transcriptional regulator [Actinokineospora terrae]SES25882.1 DNA-binding transcriptional activator of the SARP family [Actinokineospora terrae]